MSGKNKPVTRLKDLEVQEVSIVDRPANQRRFLTVKSEDGMADKGAEIVTDDQGNLITASGASDPAPAPTLPSAGPAAVLPLERDFPSIGDIFKAAGQNFEILEKRLSIDPELRTEVFRSLGDAMGRLNSVMASADMAQTDRGDKPSTLTPILAAELFEVSKVIAKTSKMLSGGVKKDEGEPGDPEPGDDFGAALGALSSSLEKAGAKMSKGRLQQFEKALSLLGKILGEIKGGGMPEPAQKSEETRVSRDEQIERLFGELTSQVTALTETVQKSNSRITSLEKRPGQSNAIPVEKSAASAPADDEVHWPMDMNDEKTRDSVDKSVNFFDN